ncbi:hypothetical protein EZV76_15645 [Flagellimonas alvinocaridis]|uniref:Uncharacterized protein n=1 Tax=Flagellimonas alvinocaridis TaxID=2530200 RepID=A0A4V4HWH4_9FLAO|nr:hypothetical protein [Allomuricauda alvinocaridis]THV57196.1 hypothetical protein EZV76_15645 [Allomuricauda alvinocaridis]
MKYEVEIKDEEEFLSKIEDLKLVYDSGIDDIIFMKVVQNLHNGLARFGDRNEFDLKGWVVFFNKYHIKITVKQLEHVFKYLLKYYPSVLSNPKGDIFKQLMPKNIKNDELGSFLFEKIALKGMAT